MDRQIGRRLLKHDFEPDYIVDSERMRLWKIGDEIFSRVLAFAKGTSLKKTAIREFNKHNNHVKALLEKHQGYFKSKRAHYMQFSGMGGIGKASFSQEEGNEAKACRGKGARTMIFMIAYLLLCQGNAFSLEIPWTNIQLVNAIYIVEGGKHATYPYGIKSVGCNSESECRRICITTIKHYRHKYAISTGTRQEFIDYVQKHYCPTNGHLSRAERRLNRNWSKNLRYILKKTGERS